MALPVTIPNEFANATASIPLSQLDTNFTTLANAVNGISSGSETLANASVTVLTAGTVDINGGTIDDTAIGGSTPAAGSFTTLNTSGAVVFNDAGADVDFRVESDTVDHALFVEGSSGNVGIGVIPSAWRSSDTVFQVGPVASLNSDTDVTTDVGYNYFYNSSNVPIYSTTAQASRYSQYLGAHRFFTAPSGTAGNAITFTQAMTLDASGNLLVAQSSGGSGKLRVSGGGDAFNTSYSSPSAAYFWSSNSNDSNCVEIYQGRFDKTGLTMSNNNTGTVTQIAFFQTGTERGSISTNNSVTAYNTSSDYRLKENVAPMTGALSKVLELNPVTYTWKIDGSAGEGFIAHELQAVCPDAVTGEKDATEIRKVEVSPAVPATYDDEGNELTPAVEAVYEEREVPKYQGVDTSFLVATLTAAIQELSAKNDALEARIAALENA